MTAIELGFEVTDIPKDVYMTLFTGQPRALKSIATATPCRCGRLVGYLTIGHVPIAFHPDDERLEMWEKMGVIVDAPPNAVLYDELSGLPKCWNKVSG